MDIAIVDLDGVVANSDERFSRASDSNGRVNWKVAFDPTLVALDTLLPGAKEAVKHLEQQGHTIRFLTSRPESMRAATEIWLAQYELQTYELLMKPASAQFTKTIIWKANTVQQIATMPNTRVACFIDDEEANRTAVEALGLGIVCLPNLDGYKA